MTLNTRRTTGMATNGTQLLEAMDAFKRKHVSQNKEIIHRNSDLLRANADLTKRLRAVQEEIIVSRREHAAVVSVNAQLEARIADLTREVNTARSSRRRRSITASFEEGIQRQPAAHASDLHTMQANLTNVILQLQGIHALCYQVACPPQEAQYSAYEPASPPISPPSAHLANVNPQLIPLNSALQRPPPKDAAAETMLAYPDLSHISEGSQETSMSMAAMRLNDIEDYESEQDQEQEETVVQAYYDQINLAQSAGASSRASSIEPDFDADSLIAKPLAGGVIYEHYAADSANTVSETSSVASIGGTSRPLRKRRSSSRITSVDDTNKSPEISRSPSSDGLMSDVRQIQRLPLRKKSRPSLLNDLALSPGQMISRVLDPNLTASTSALHGETAQDLSEHSAKRSPCVQNMKAADPTVRRSSTESISAVLTIDEATPAPSQRRKSLVGMMSARPVDAKYSSLDAISTIPSGSASMHSITSDQRPKSTSQKTSSGKTVLAQHRRVRSVPVEAATASVNKATVAAFIVSKATLHVTDLARPRRSTTPEMEPPPADILQILHPTLPLLAVPPARPALAAIKPSSVGGQRAASQSPRIELMEKSPRDDAPSKITVRRRAVSSSQAADDMPVSRTGVASISASSDNADAAEEPSASARDSRRARIQVSYQEPSLSKKMRQPAGYVPSIKTAASMRNVLGGGVRRKSSLQSLYDRSDIASTTTLSTAIREEASH